VVEELDSPADEVVFAAEVDSLLVSVFVPPSPEDAAAVRESVR
jgi:hypothetical protein